MSIGSSRIPSLRATNDFGRLSKFERSAVFVWSAFFFSGILGVLGLGTIIWVVLGSLLLGVVVVRFLVQGIQVGPFLIWLYAFGLVPTVWLLSSSMPNAVYTFQQFIAQLIVMLTAYLIFSDLMAQKCAEYAILLVSIFGVAINVFELMSHQILSNTPGRSAGFYVNPNGSAAALVLGMIIADRVVPVNNRGLYRALILCGILPTFSRGGLIAWVVAIIMMMAVERKQRKIFKLSKVPFIAGTIMLLVFVATPIGAHLYGGFTQNEWTTQRITSVEGVEDDNRVLLVYESLHTIGISPLLGQGTGTPNLVIKEGEQFGPHNMYLSLWIQFGIAGLALLPSLLLTIRDPLIDRRTGLPFIATLLVIGAFNHTMFYYPQYGILIALAHRVSVTEGLPKSVRRTEA